MASARRARGLVGAGVGLGSLPMRAAGWGTQRLRMAETRRARWRRRRLLHPPSMLAVVLVALVLVALVLALVLLALVLLAPPVQLRRLLALALLRLRWR